MSDENKKKEDKPGNDLSDKAEELIEKGKDLADKAEDYFTEKIDQVKSSDAFVKISGFFGKVEDFIEAKSEEIHSGEMSAKIETFKEKTGNQASELLRKAKEAGLKIGDQVDETLDALKGKKDKPGNQNGEGI